MSVKRWRDVVLLLDTRNRALTGIHVLEFRLFLICPNKFSLTHIRSKYCRVCTTSTLAHVK